MVAEPIPTDARQQALEAVRAERARRLAEQEEAERKRAEAAKVDIADWAESRFYIKETKRPIIFVLYQKAILRAMFQRLPNGMRRFHNGLWSSIKKTGKTTIGAVICRYFAETQTFGGEVLTIGNDLKQSIGREFKFVKDSIRFTPGARRTSGKWVLPGQWICQGMKMECLLTDSTIEAISIDAAGEAGGAPDLTCWTELWGMTGTEVDEFWGEMTPVLTKPDSFRFVESYAGNSGESKLLEEQYNLGKSGRQLTNHELAEMGCRDVDGERYEDMLWAFEETQGDPGALVPVWIHETAGLFMYWDEDEPEGIARRMPWQKGERGEVYYREQALNIGVNQYTREHRNKWASSQGAFVPMESWDACREDLPPFLPENKEPCVFGVDAATTHDCFAIVATTRNPNRERDPAIRACKKYDPKMMGGTVDYSKPEAFLRCKIIGGCAAGHPLLPNKSEVDPRFQPEGEKDCEACRDNIMVPPYNVQMVTYDRYQLEDMMQRLRRELGVRCKPFDQIKERLIADHGLYMAIVQRKLAHDGNLELREHIENAASKTDTQESKMRIVKKAPDKKVDLAVAASMAVREIMRLVLTAEG